MDPFSNENKGENLSALLYWAEGNMEISSFCSRRKYIWTNQVKRVFIMQTYLCNILNLLIYGLKNIIWKRN